VEHLGLMEPAPGSLPFSSAGWAFSLPATGYRMLAEFGAGVGEARGGLGARLRSRRGAEAARWFPEVARALAALSVPRTVVDGEVCVLDAAGRSDLALLHARALQPGRLPGTSPVVLCLRDVLVWEGRDVRALPWHERRQLLQTLPLQERPALKRECIVRAEGLWLYRQAQAIGHEAIHAHRADAPYVAGPSIAWVSIAVAAGAQDRAA
jgi:bifunctional non-homologous end joining protein LigD